MSKLKILNNILINSANYNNIATQPTTVGSNGGPSAYGTYDQSGNVFEWNDLDLTSSPERGFRGGSWKNIVIFRLSSSFRFTVSLLRRSRFIGFRIAANLLNPSNLSNLVTITDINNNNDTTGYGGVTYAYQISKFPITNFEYTEFLNNIASTDTYGLYNTNMNSTRFGGITRSGVSGSYTYATKTNMENSPVVFINWFDTARYCNWLHNNKPTGNQNNNTTESGAYTLNGAISGNAIPKNISAIYWIPNENEWYKAAYYKGGGTNAGYWTYATQSDSEPTFVVRNALGNGLISSISVSPKIKQSKIR